MNSNKKVTKNDIIKLVYKYNYFKPGNSYKLHLADLLISDVGPALLMEYCDIDLIKKVIPKSHLLNSFHNKGESSNISYDELFDRVLYKRWPRY